MICPQVFMPIVLVGPLSSSLYYYIYPSILTNTHIMKKSGRSYGKSSDGNLEVNRLSEELILKSEDPSISSSQNLKKVESIKSSDSAKKDKTDPEEEQISCMESLRRKLFNTIQTCPRTIQLSGSCTPQNNQTNLVKNTKYNLFTFVPKVLFNQFKFFFNLFFLITALTQLIEVFRVGLFVTFIGPLVLVLSLTMGKEAYDDYRTYLRDIQANSKIYEVIKKGKREQVKSKDLNVGDVVVVKSGNRIPADMLTLYSDDEQGTLFLKTDQLDGETDWKLRKAVKMTQSLIKEDEDFEKLIDENLCCTVKQPIGQIYSFEGLFKNSDNGDKQKLTLENTLWTSCVLTNGQIIGLVMYVGRETRVAMGASSPRTKVGILDHEINYLSKVLFLIMVGLTCVLLFLQATEWKYMPIQFVRVLILLSSIIPISMRVNLDFAKLFYAYQINNDKYIKGTITRNSNCPEELGRVKYILSDKTGTLTQNEMLFRRISIEDTIKFTDENQNEMRSIIEDYENIPDNIQSKQKCLKEIITALALCHNVTPVYEDKKEDKSKIIPSHIDQRPRSPPQNDRSIRRSDVVDDVEIEKLQNQRQSSKSQKSQNFKSTNQKQKEKDFQASSPDEITFVKIVQKFGMILKSRTQTDITIILPSGKETKYQILNIFPFSSETKRMGIIIKNPETDQITLYLKGADAVMKNFVLNRQKKGFIEEECKDLSMTGLRTLVISKKQLKEEQYQKWSQKFQEANNKLEVDKKQIQQIMEELEKGVEFLGITGIEDKLQNKLKPTIESLKSANIKIWMITGDKIETAECISRSCGLQASTEENIKIEEVDNANDWKAKWESVKKDLSKVLIIDGKTLLFVLEKQDGDLKQIAKDFYLTAIQMPAVICCRCSPQQKRTLTEGVKKYRKQKQSVLGIGDGGNDVGMIQAADIGVGIVGKQGNQAALAADFSILEFRNIKCLLLWHGRLSYKRSALLASFIIHRGFIFSVIQILFSCIFFYVSIPVFNSYLQLGYATIFTFWPVFSLILDEDIDKKRALKYPALYESLQKSNQLDLISFMSWVWKAGVQGSLIMILSILLFQDDSYLKIETICFTTLIITEYSMTLSQIHRMHVLTLACVGGSLLCYFACLFFLRSAMSLSAITFADFGFIIVITLISWGPLLAWRIVKSKFFPSDYQKVMKNVKRNLIEKKILKSSIQSVGEETKQSILNY